VTVGAATQTQVRCRECNRRLGDFNELQAGGNRRPNGASAAVGATAVPTTEPEGGA
jgi:hypothetical protein